MNSTHILACNRLTYPTRAGIATTVLLWLTIVYIRILGIKYLLACRHDQLYHRCAQEVVKCETENSLHNGYSSTDIFFGSLKKINDLRLWSNLHICEIWFVHELWQHLFYYNYYRKKTFNVCYPSCSVCNLDDSYLTRVSAQVHVCEVIVSMQSRNCLGMCLLPVCGCGTWTYFWPNILGLQIRCVQPQVSAIISTHHFSLLRKTRRQSNAEPLLYLLLVGSGPPRHWCCACNPQSRCFSVTRTYNHSSWKRQKNLD